MTEKVDKKEKVLSFASAISIIALCWALYTGVLDRGTSAGSLSEKVATLERVITRNETIVSAISKELKENSISDHQSKIDITKLQTLYEHLSAETKEMRRVIEDIRDRQTRGER